MNFVFIRECLVFSGLETFCEAWGRGWAEIGTAYLNVPCLPNYAPAPSPWIFGTSSKYRNTLLHVVFHGCYGKKCLPSNPITIVTYRTLEMYPKRSKMKKIGMVVDIFWFCLYQSTNILFSLSSTSQMLYKSRKTCLLAFCPASNQGVKFNTSGMSCLAQRCIITVQDIWSSLKCP